jgi:hypothetical protein
MNTDDFSSWDTSDQWLDWLGDEPQQSVRDALEMFLGKRIPDCSLLRVKLTAAPKQMMGARGTAESEQVTVSRIGLMFEFEATIASAPDRTEDIEGTFTWVATNLDGDRVDFGFLDLGEESESAGDQFPLRMYAEA